MRGWPIKLYEPSLTRPNLSALEMSIAHAIKHYTECPDYFLTSMERWYVYVLHHDQIVIYCRWRNAPRHRQQVTDILTEHFSMIIVPGHVPFPTVCCNVSILTIVMQTPVLDTFSPEAKCLASNEYESESKSHLKIGCLRLIINNLYCDVLKLPSCLLGFLTSIFHICSCVL